MALSAYEVLLKKGCTRFTYERESPDTGSEAERNIYKAIVGSFGNQEHCFMKDMSEGVTHVVIRKGVVLFFSFLTPPLGYVIKSKTVAKNYKQFFMMLWNIAESK